MKYVYDGKELNKIKEKDKFFYLCYKCGWGCKNKCCKKNKNKHLEGVDNFFKKNLTIDKYLEESFLNKDKDKSIQKYIHKNEDKIKKELMVEMNDIEPNDDKNITKNILNDEILFRVDSLKDEEIKK